MISDEKSREEMIAKLPTQLFSATCIGCGLDLAVQVFLSLSHNYIMENYYSINVSAYIRQMLNENDGTSETGGVIVLVTDGKNSPGYLHISDVEEDVIKAGIRVITIAFGCESIIRSFTII